MPYINIRIGAALSQEQRSTLYRKTTGLMHTIMGKKRVVTVVHIQESGPESWSTNGVTLSSEDPTCVYVDIKITEGTNTADQKAEMIASMIKVLEEVVGAIQEACYVVISDIAANSWGYNGKTQAARAA